MAVALASCSTTKVHSRKGLNGEVQIVGAMKNVMQQGQLAGVISLDTIRNKQGLYGLGPVEYLRRELLVVDGKSYRSIVSTDSTTEVEETFQTKAPFFVYANVADWNKEILPDSIRTIGELEHYLHQRRAELGQPFAFKLKGVIKTANIHVQNLPAGVIVSSPQKAHLGQKNYELKNKSVGIVGFFSTEHQGIFTHHDSFLHMHLITADKTAMGHLDAVTFADEKVTLYLPKTE